MANRTDPDVSAWTKDWRRLRPRTLRVPKEKFRTPEGKYDKAAYGRAWFAANKSYRKKYWKFFYPRHRQNVLSKRAEFLRLAKQKPCADCGHRFPECCMDFDHGPIWGKKHPRMKGGPRRKSRCMASFAQRCSWADLRREIAKCEVVCANCHRIRTAAQRAEKFKNAV